MRLDINANNLILDIKEKYYLDMKLPYAVLPEKGNAKLDSKTKKLKITLIVDHTKITNQEKEKITLVEEKSMNENENIEKEEKNSPKTEENQNKTENFGNIADDNNILEFKEKNEFLKVSNEKKELNNHHDENPEKKLIEEIVGADEKNNEEKELEQKENKTKIPSILEFKTQDQNNKFFVIIHLPNYSRDSCSLQIKDQEVSQ